MAIIIKVLGAIDLLAAVCFWLFAFFHTVPKEIVLLLGLIILVKGLVFLIFKDIASILDIICSVVFFIAIGNQIPAFISIIVSLFLVQKGIFSWIN